METMQHRQSIDVLHAEFRDKLADQITNSIDEATQRHHLAGPEACAIVIAALARALASVTLATGMSEDLMLAFCHGYYEALQNPQRDPERGPPLH